MRLIRTFNLLIVEALCVFIGSSSERADYDIYADLGSL